MADNKSFIAYTEWLDYFEDLTNEQLGELIRKVFQYKLTGELPEKEEIDISYKTIFKFIVNSINRDSEKWEKEKEKRSEAGKKGAAKRWDNKNGNAITPMAKDNIAINDIAKMAVNVNVNDNVNVNVNDNVNVNSSEENKKLLAEATPEPLKDFGKKIYTLFKENELPIEKDIISFLIGSLKNGCEIIHSNPAIKNATSQEILQAVENYIDILNDNDCYYTYKHSFMSLCKNENFYKFFPSNFVKENWLKFEKKEQNEKQEEKAAEDPYNNIKWIKGTCSNCGADNLYIDIIGRTCCYSCKRIFDNDDE